MQQFIKQLYHKKNFIPRLILVNVAVIVMGFCLSLLLLVDLGTDPCTCLNRVIASLLHMSIGNWQALLNCILFVFVILWGPENIGFGTIANMFLVGYSLDFFSMIWAKVFPADLFASWSVRIIVLILSLTVFVFAAALYMDVKLGTAPYDAIPFMIYSRQHKLSFRVIRIIFDYSVIVLAFLLGSKVGIVTILMGFSLGPVITYVGGLIRPLVDTGEDE